MSNYNYFGFETLNRRTNEFGLMCVNREIGFPKKRKILVDVPFSNTIYDFSNIYGGQTFDNRLLAFTFLFNGMRKDALHRTWTNVANWLMSGKTKSPLYDDRMQRYYYLAEISEIQNFEEAYEEGYLTIEFSCYPFRIYELQEGNDIWDTFNFELDIAQHTSFKVNGVKDAMLFNTGIPTLNPSIQTSNEMKIIMNNRRFEIPRGFSKDSRFRLITGENHFSIEGHGMIDFIFHKEVI